LNFKHSDLELLFQQGSLLRYFFFLHTGNANSSGY